MKHIIMGTAGHIDHGKTTLIEALTGIDCDTHKEEKERGITINLGFAHMPLSAGYRIGIVDVPGHRDFVHTMVGGASGIDFVLLVVAADSGVMPQTLEHLQIMGVLGIKHGLIALTKVDLVEPDIVELAESEIVTLVQGTFLEGCAVARVCSITNEGIDELKALIDRVAQKVPSRPVGETFRLFVDRLFTVKGFGAVATGSVASGALHAGGEAYLLPAEKKLRVRRLERFGEEVKEIVAGDRASINVVGLDREDFTRGAVIADRILRPTEMVDAKLRLFQHSRSFDKLWNHAIFHLGTYEHQARIHLISCDRLTEGQTALVQIHLDYPCNAQYGDSFVIRSTSNDMTLGGGQIIDAFPLSHRKRPKKLVESMARIAGGGILDLVAVEVGKHVGAITHREIADSLSVSPEQIFEAVSGNPPAGITTYSQNDTIYLITTAEHGGLEQRALDAIAAFHRRKPLESKGLTTGELMGLVRVERGSPGEPLLSLLLDRLAQEGKLKRVQRTWALFDHAIDITPELSSQVSFAADYLQQCGMQTPIQSELISAGAEQNITEQKFRDILHYLVEQGTVYHADGNYIHAEIVDRSRVKLLRALSERKQGVTVAEFRDLVKGNRRICLLLLKIFDGEGITERAGDFRLLTERGAAILQEKGS